MSLVRVEVTDDQVAHVTLARAQKRNAINAELAADFAAGAAEVAARGIRSAILTADGPVFCAGADLSDLHAGGQAVDDVVDALLGAPLHWTAVVRQPVLGAGLALLAACPLVLATDQAGFALPELAKGFFPAALMPGQIATLGGRAAYELAFSAAPVNATRAATLGLVSAVYADDEIDAIAAQRAGEIATHDPDALAEGIAHWQGFARRMLRA